MAEQKTIDRVKVDLRVSHTSLDADISDNIDSCLADLRITAGVESIDENDPIILAAIKMYVRAMVCDDTAKAEAYMTRYNQQKACLQMAQGYGGCV